MSHIEEKLLLDICAEDVKGDKAIDAVSKKSFAVPAPVPEDSAFSWEFQGRSNEQIELPHEIPLDDEYTIAFWAKLAPFADRDAGSTIFSGSEPWFILGEDKESVCVPLGSSSPPACVPLTDDPKRLTSWHLFVLVGCSEKASFTHMTSFLSATGGEGMPKFRGSWFRVTLAGARLRKIGGGALGWLTSVKVWGRRLSRTELRGVWEEGAKKLGLTVTAPGPEEGVHVLPAPPKKDVVRVSGRIVESGTDSPLVGVTVVCGLVKGPVESGQDGVFFIDVPLTGSGKGANADNSEKKEKEKESFRTSVTLSLPGFSPQTVAVVPEPNWGGGTLEVGTVSLLKHSATAVLDSSKGGSLEDKTTGMTFSIPPNAFVLSDGRPFIGEASVSVSTIDPSDPQSLEAMPGDFSAKGVDGKETKIQSFGAMFLEATGGGERLSLSKESGGVSVEWKSSLDMTAVEETGQFPSMWTFDEETASWIQEADPVTANGKELPPAGVSVGDVVSEQKERDVLVKKKNKATMSEAMKARMGDSKVENFLEFFGSKDPKDLKASMKEIGKWYNLDLPYLETLMRGRIPLEVLEEVRRASAPLLNQADAGAASGPPPLNVVGSCKKAFTRSYCTVKADGSFAMVVPNKDKVTLKIQGPSVDFSGSELIGVPSGGYGRKERRFWTVGPLESAAGLGEVRDLGIVEARLEFHKDD
uniref:Uncharacterized protein n=1 Tax=Chromera velia CCMP2878 TaxID=1169474 RepID=A0A0G4IBH4_9ALVE|eukprot:Cvel_12761.t1-p1 / transcript=Cvel_12761.t1 / gene=Cvel_12761 / organism=Chromera_velia_CCMP2878 / gene_product=Cartilage intermediate layer protein 2, putative / transcript_product=Cartilage intermediate layer protein 2, putative / location=Cvel_scaffold848:55158-58036(-) / protein_length=697 / sequence_SO=supercontig / SO=protein_coding / is_pseudo=false